MARRKTIDVAAIVKNLNAQIQRYTDEPVKIGLCTAIEEILHETGNYNGYVYTFWNFETMEKYRTIDAAIAAGVGTEYDRRYSV